MILRRLPWSASIAVIVLITLIVTSARRPRPGHARDRKLEPRPAEMLASAPEAETLESPEERSSQTVATTPEAPVPTLCGRSADLPSLLPVARMFKIDPEMAARIRKELAAWIADPDPDVRKRGEVMLAELELGWEQAALRHPIPHVRCALLESPPDVKPETIDLLIGVAQADLMPEIRAAALRGLPAGLDAAAAARLAACLDDPDPRVVDTAVVALRGASSIDANTIQALKMLAFGPAGRRQARLTLLKFSDLLDPDDQEALAQLLSGRTDRAK